MKGSTKRDKRMARENIVGLMVVVIRASGSKIEFQDQESTSGSMAERYV
jgi:hypothetical protein